MVHSEYTNYKNYQEGIHTLNITSKKQLLCETSTDEEGEGHPVLLPGAIKEDPNHQAMLLGCFMPTLPRHPPIVDLPCGVDVTNSKHMVSRSCLHAYTLQHLLHTGSRYSNKLQYPLSDQNSDWYPLHTERWIHQQDPLHTRHCIVSLQWRHDDHDSVSNHQPRGCLLNRLFRRRSKKTSKLRVTGLCAGNSPGTGELPAQMASYAENVSIWWRHHGCSPYPWWWHASQSDMHIAFITHPGRLTQHTSSTVLISFHTTNFR